jgi:hypothetical protein
MVDETRPLHSSPQRNAMMSVMVLLATTNSIAFIDLPFFPHYGDGGG